jgi:hypothetical protein
MHVPPAAIRRLALVAAEILRLAKRATPNDRSVAVAEKRAPMSVTPYAAIGALDRSAARADAEP